MMMKVTKLTVMMMMMVAVVMSDDAVAASDYDDDYKRNIQVYFLVKALVSHQEFLL